MAAQEGAEAGSFLKEDLWFGADVIVLKKARESRAAQWWRLALWSPMMCHRTKFGRVCPLGKLASGLLRLNLFHQAHRRVSDLREPVREFE
jgi:hypothetical protein